MRPSPPRHRGFPCLSSFVVRTLRRWDRPDRRLRWQIPDTPSEPIHNGRCRSKRILHRERWMKVCTNGSTPTTGLSRLNFSPETSPTEDRRIPHSSAGNPSFRISREKQSSDLRSIRPARRGKESLGAGFALVQPCRRDPPTFSRVQLPIDKEDVSDCTRSTRGSLVRDRKGLGQGGSQTPPPTCLPLRHIKKTHEIRSISLVPIRSREHDPQRPPLPGN